MYHGQIVQFKLLPKFRPFFLINNKRMIKIDDNHMADYLGGALKFINPETVVRSE